MAVACRLVETDVVVAAVESGAVAVVVVGMPGHSGMSPGMHRPRPPQVAAGSAAVHGYARHTFHSLPAVLCSHAGPAVAHPAASAWSWGCRRTACAALPVAGVMVAGRTDAAAVAQTGGSQAHRDHRAMCQRWRLWHQPWLASIQPCLGYRRAVLCGRAVDTVVMAL